MIPLSEDVLRREFILVVVLPKSELSSMSVAFVMGVPTAQGSQAAAGRRSSKASQTGFVCWIMSSLIRHLCIKACALPCRVDVGFVLG